MGFSYPRLQEPTIRRCRSCGRQIRYANGRALKAPGWVHIGFTNGIADWVRCGGVGEPVPMEAKRA